MGKLRTVQKVRSIPRLREAIDVSWQEALEQFLSWKRAQNLAPNSLDKYIRENKLFFKRFPNCFNENLVEAVYEHMAQSNLKPVSYNHRLLHIGCFFKWCVQEQILDSNPLEGFKIKPTDDKIIDVDDETLKKLLKLPNKINFAGLRDYTLICLSLDTGIRPGEAFQLTNRDINFETLEVYIRSEVAKTGVKRTLPIVVETARSIKKLMLSHHPAWGEKCPIFCSSEGTLLNRSTWGQRIRDYGKYLGIQLSPGSFRHIFALHFLRNGVAAHTLMPGSYHDHLPTF